MTVLWIVIVLVVAAVCAGAGYFARKYLGEAKIASAEKAAEQIVTEAQRQAETIAAGSAAGAEG